jgi:hypothetical protein
MIVTTSDVFCDGIAEDHISCSEWVHGVVSGTSRTARLAAAEHGWVRKTLFGKVRDLCPHCQKELARGS